MKWSSGLEGLALSAALVALWRLSRSGAATSSPLVDPSPPVQPEPAQSVPVTPITLSADPASAPARGPRKHFAIGMAVGAGSAAAVGALIAAVFLLTPANSAPAFVAALLPAATALPATNLPGANLSEPDPPAANLNATEGESPSLAASSDRDREQASPDLAEAPASQDEITILPALSALPSPSPELLRVVHGWLNRSGVPNPAPARALPPGPNPLIPLVARLSPLIEQFDATAGVAVIDLQTGHRIDVNGRQQFQAASTIKFFATLSALQDIENGLYTYATIADDLYGIMVLQSNAHARNLTLRTGIPAINRRLDIWGLDGTVIAHPSGYRWEQDPSFDEDENDNLTSPSDAARALELLYTAQIAEPDLSRTLINRMTQGRRWFGIEGAVPDGQGHVFYKVGWLPVYGLSSVNDIGIVEFQRDGRTLSYAIAIYTQGAVPQGSAWVLVRDLAVASWDFFAYERYAPGSPALAASLVGG